VGCRGGGCASWAKMKRVEMLQERGFGIRGCVNLIRFVLVVCVLVIVCLIVSLPALTLAAPLATPVLPPRPTPRSTPATEMPPPGAYIELQVLSAPAGLWTKVQWQDSWGGWHDVEGWQGTLDTVDQKVWWVAPKDFGTGPYRWAIYAGRSGPSLGASDPFYLPDATEQRVRVRVSVSPQAQGQARPEVWGDAGIEALPHAGGTQQLPTSHLIALLLALVGLLAVLSTPWCAAPAKKGDKH
jgi:hypothetical protein